MKRIENFKEFGKNDEISRRHFHLLIPYPQISLKGKDKHISVLIIMQIDLVISVTEDFVVFKQIRMFS